MPSFRLPPLYAPPGSRSANRTGVSNAETSSLHDHEEVHGGSILRQLEEATDGQLPFLRLNPLGPMMYAWNITDRALAVDEKGQGVNLGLMGEPTGSGVSFSEKVRGGLLIMLSSPSGTLLESHLVSPISLRNRDSYSPSQKAQYLCCQTLQNQRAEKGSLKAAIHTWQLPTRLSNHIWSDMLRSDSLW